MFGDADEKALKEAAREIRDDLRSLPGMGDISLGGVRTDEISVEVRPGALLEYGIALPVIADRIRKRSPAVSTKSSLSCKS